MKPASYLRTAAMVAALATGSARAADPEVEPVGGLRHRSAGPVWPPAIPPRGPVVPAAPCPPGTQMPPGATVPPGPLPPGTIPPGTLPPGTPPTVPDPAAPQPPAPATDVQATQAGTAATRTALPQVFGDLPGSGGIAGPLPVRVLNGQFIGPAPVVVRPDGTRMTLNNPNGRMAPTDELILGRPATLPTTTPGGTTVGVLPPPGTVFAPELAEFVSRLPQVARGAFKITENDTPRPTTRAYVTYNFYDQLFKNVGGPNTPRVILHQEIFGYEQAFADDQFSVGVRVPYNQLTSPGFFNKTAIGDLTIIAKAVIAENRQTGSLLSGGLVVTVPTGDSLFASTITGEDVRPTLIQPFLGYIWVGGDVFVQGFSSIVVPTDDRDTTFISNDLAVGYYVYRAPGSLLSAITPVAEFHLNNPLNHRGRQEEPVGFFDQFTMLGGAHFFFYDRSSLGFAVGAPVTGPRPFSLQATVQANFRF